MAIENTACLLPETEDTTEDFNWVQREIQQQQGEAWVFRSEVVSGWTDETIRELFGKQRVISRQEEPPVRIQ